MCSEGTKSVHNGQNNFIKGALAISNKALGDVGTAVTVGGYGSMLFGAGPFGAAFAELGVVLSNISLGIDSGLKINDGNYSGAAINLGTYGLGRAGKKGVKALGNKGLNKSILNANAEIKTDITKRVGDHVNNEMKKKKK